MITLIDFLTFRMAELGRTFAGCVLTEPQVLPMVDQVGLRSITDERARTFLSILQDQSNDLTVERIAELADLGGYMGDCLRWLSMATAEPIPSEDLAGKVVQQLGACLIAYRVFQDLQDELQAPLNQLLGKVTHGKS